MNEFVMIGVRSALVVVAVMFFMLLLRSSANRPAKRDPKTGDLVLQCGKTFVWITGTLAVGGPLAMGLLSFVIPFQHPAQVFVPIGIGAFFLLLGGMMCLWALRRRTRVGDKGLTSEYMLFAPQFLAWQDVRKVDFASGQEFWVRGHDGKKAMLHVWFTGVKESVPLLRQHLPAEVQNKCASAIERFAATTGAV